VGVAATVKFVPDSQYDQKDPYGAGIDFLDTLQVGEIAVIGTVASVSQLSGESSSLLQLKVVAQRVL